MKIRFVSLGCLNMLKFNNQFSFQCTFLAHIIKKVFRKDTVVDANSQNIKLLLIQIKNIIYKSCDVFVLPSTTQTSRNQKVTKFSCQKNTKISRKILNEGMSNALLEAMGTGLPVIATDTGGTHELIDGNGIIVPMGDSNAIAEAIRGLMDDPETRMRMGMRSREIAKGMGWSAVSEAYLKLYEELT